MWQLIKVSFNRKTSSIKSLEPFGYSPLLNMWNLVQAKTFVL